MSYIEEMLEFNKKFVAGKKYEAYVSTKYPNKKIAIVSCMDTRLTELLPAALNLKNGDVQIVKTAGAVIPHPFGGVMRSLLVAVYELGVEDIIVIGHHDCGMQNMRASRLLEKMVDRGIDREKIELIANCGIDTDKWLKGFDRAEDAVTESVHVIRSHPMIPADIRVHGFVMDPVTGKLEKV